MNNGKIYKVIHIIDSENLVVNAGEEDGVKYGDKFVIYGIGNEMYDLDTNEALGKLELVRGVGKVVHLQEKICIVRSDMYKREPEVTEIVSYPNAIGALSYTGRLNEERRIVKPGKEIREGFKSPEKGDYVRYI